MDTPARSLVERLMDGPVEHPKRWSGDTHTDLGGSIDEDATSAVMKKGAVEIERLQGAMRANDQRLATAGARVGIVAGCDTADAMADQIERLKGELQRARSALKGLSDMYGHAWDAVDGGLLMMGESVPRFEAAHRAAHEILSPETYAHDELSTVSPSADVGEDLVQASVEPSAGVGAVIVPEHIQDVIDTLLMNAQRDVLKGWACVPIGEWDGLERLLRKLLAASPLPPGPDDITNSVETKP